MSANTYLPATPTTPLALLITAITNSYPMLVTAQIPNLYILPTVPNTYHIGQVVRLNIPSDYGMLQANGLPGKILAINGLIFALDIDSRGFDVFVVPPMFAPQPATFAPSGSNNLQFDNTTDLVPFQSGSTLGN